MHNLSFMLMIYSKMMVLTPPRISCLYAGSRPIAFQFYYCIHFILSCTPPGVPAGLYFFHCPPLQSASVLRKKLSISLPAEKPKQPHMPRSTRPALITVQHHLHLTKYKSNFPSSKPVSLSKQNNNGSIAILLFAKFLALQAVLHKQLHVL